MDEMVHVYKICYRIPVKGSPHPMNPWMMVVTRGGREGAIQAVLDEFNIQVKDILRVEQVTTSPNVIIDI